MRVPQEIVVTISLATTSGELIAFRSCENAGSAGTSPSAVGDTAPADRVDDRRRQIPFGPDQPADRGIRH